MRHNILTSLAISFCLTMPAQAVEFWHSSTVWAGQGRCSAMFEFDSGMKDLRNLQVTVSVVSEVGKKVATGQLKIPHFGRSSADRYANAFIEGEEICADDLIVVVNKATAIVDGRSTDLLKTKAISARAFKPFKIRFGH